MSTICFDITNTILTVTTTPTQQTERIIFIIPRTDINTQVDKVRIQALAYGSKNTKETHKEDLFSYNSSYLFE